MNKKAIEAATKEMSNRKLIRKIVEMDRLMREDSDRMEDNAMRERVWNWHDEAWNELAVRGIVDDDTPPNVVVHDPEDHRAAIDPFIAADAIATDRWIVELHDGTIYEEPHIFRVATDNSAGVRFGPVGEDDAESFSVDDITRIEWYGPREEGKDSRSG